MASRIDPMDGQERLRKMQLAGFPMEDISEVVQHQNRAFLTEGQPIELIGDYWGVHQPNADAVKRFFSDEFKRRLTISQDDTAAAAEPGRPATAAEPGRPATAEFRDATNIIESIFAGFQVSASGLALRGELPTLAVPEDADTATRVASGLATLLGDFPFMVIGAFAGLLAGAPSGPGAAIVGTAGAFALPEGLRTLMMEMYERGEISTVGEFMEIALATFESAGKGAVVGAATGGVGRIGRGDAGRD